MVKHWQALLILIILVFLTYANALHNKFVSDDWAIVNDTIEIKNRLFINPLIYWIDVLIAGKNPVIFHLTNIFFHLGSTLLLYFILIHLTYISVAFFAASLFAVHPVLSEAVTWISGSGYLQYTFFFLFSFLFYLLSYKYKKLYLLSLFFYIFSLSSSTKALVLCPIFLIFELTFKKNRNYWKKTLPYVLLTILWGFSLISGVNFNFNNLTFQEIQPYNYDNLLVKIPIAISTYLGLIFWPYTLTFYHTENIYNNSQLFVDISVFILFVIFIFLSLIKNRKIFFCLMIFIIPLLPTLTPLRVSWVVAERYIYLSSIGIIILIAGLWNKYIHKSKQKTVSYLLFFFLIALLSARTIIRNADWYDEDTLWVATVKSSPLEPKSHNNMGDYFVRHGNLKRANDEFKIAVDLDPNFAGAWHNLGNSYWDLGQDNKAIESYLKAISLNSVLVGSYQNLGLIYLDHKEYTLAEKYTTKALSLNPNNVILLNNLGAIYLMSGDKIKAQEVFKKVLTIDQNNKNALFGLQQTIN